MISWRRSATWPARSEGRGNLRPGAARASASGVGLADSCGMRGGRGPRGGNGAVHQGAPGPGERYHRRRAGRENARSTGAADQRRPRARRAREAIPLPDASADVVFVSTAWHWLDPALAIPEIARVLRDGGRLGVIWTSRDRAEDWVAELDLLRLPACHARTGPRAGGRRAAHRGSGAEGAGPPSLGNPAARCALWARGGRVVHVHPDDGGRRLPRTARSLLPRPPAGRRVLRGVGRPCSRKPPVTRGLRCRCDRGAG